MSLLNLINTGADVLTATNTARTARDVEQQSQMLFDAMTPEQQAQVLAAQKVRAEAEREAKRKKDAIVGILFIVVFIGIMWVLN
jgi:hypothetical protein